MGDSFHSEETIDTSARGEGEDRPGDRTLALSSACVASSSLVKELAGLVVIQGREIGRHYRLRRPESTLGRGEGVSVRVPDELVSRRHATLEVIWDAQTSQRRVYISDLGSTNHTYVNEEEISRIELKEGDKIRVGDTILKFVVQDALDARFHEELRHRIAYDQLTGLLTRESLFAALDWELKRCARFDLTLSVLMMDLDWFKQINDTFGHLMGSHVLEEVGAILKQEFRSTDVSARYGGEEFVAYLSEVPSAEALGVAERVRAAVESHAFRRLDEEGREQGARLTISIGVSEFPQHGDTVERLVAAADEALYRAKREGRNRVCLA